MLMINEHHRGSTHIKLWEYTLNTEVAYFIDYMCQRSEDRDGFLGWWYTGENVFIVVIILQNYGNVCQNLEKLKIVYSESQGDSCQQCACCVRPRA